MMIAVQIKYPEPRPNARVRVSNHIDLLLQIQELARKFEESRKELFVRVAEIPGIELS